MDYMVFERGKRKMGCYPAPDKLSMCFWPHSRSCEDGYDLAHTKGCTKTAG